MRLRVKIAPQWKEEKVKAGGAKKAKKFVPKPEEKGN